MLDSTCHNMRQGFYRRCDTRATAAPDGARQMPLNTRFDQELRAPFYIVLHDCSIQLGRDKPAAGYYGDGIALSAEDAADLLGELTRDRIRTDYRALRLDPATGTFADAVEVYEILLRRVRDSDDEFEITTLHEHIAAA